ncbi:MAG: 16S rRNA (guanine(966)-N(2))-methyltransferase RsmD [Chloroflexota bacterium]
MRVISGFAKGRKLKQVPGTGTRPITDRVKENLLNLIQYDVPGARFLDLFAGTGSVGIEALSRGAESALFIDNSRIACQIARENLKHCQLESNAQVLKIDAFAYLSRVPQQAYDIIYIAPPQYHQLWKSTLLILDENSRWLAADGLAIVQIHPKEREELALENLVLIDERVYGSTALMFFTLAESIDDEE